MNLLYNCILHFVSVYCMLSDQFAESKNIEKENKNGKIMISLKILSRWKISFGTLSRVQAKLPAVQHHGGYSRVSGEVTEDSTVASSCLHLIPGWIFLN